MVLYDLYKLAGANPKLALSVGLGAIVLGGVFGLGYRMWRGKQDRRIEAELESTKAVDGLEEGELVSLPPPDLRRSTFGIVGEIFRTWRYLRKRRKLLNKGYVQWLLIDDAYPWPRFVKPKMKGRGVPELKYNDGRYLFPKEGAIPDASAGYWTVIHRVNEADPINLRDPDALAIPADELEEYLDKGLAIGPPSWLDKIDLTPQKVLMYGIGAIVAYAFLKGALLG